jgi:Kyakuja-Dileera-Zisupton transposase
VTSSSSASNANAINPAGPSTAADSEDPGGIDNDAYEPGINADKIAWLNLAEHDELAECLDTCVDRWRNAGPEARKKMYALFAIAGIFLAVCHHGHVLVICDMIQSGEL